MPSFRLRGHQVGMRVYMQSEQSYIYVMPRSWGPQKTTRETCNTQHPSLEAAFTWDDSKPGIAPATPLAECEPINSQLSPHPHRPMPAGSSQP